jgi:hypothetical protein
MENHAPTVPPPGPGSLNSALRRNIQALEERRKREAEAAPLEARIAEAITRFTGSMRFVYVHLVPRHRGYDFLAGGSGSVATG